MARQTPPSSPPSCTPGTARKPCAGSSSSCRTEYGGRPSRGLPPRTSSPLPRAPPPRPPSHAQTPAAPSAIPLQSSLNPFRKCRRYEFAPATRPAQSSMQDSTALSSDFAASALLVCKLATFRQSQGRTAICATNRPVAKPSGVTKSQRNPKSSSTPSDTTLIAANSFPNSAAAAATPAASMSTASAPKRSQESCFSALPATRSSVTSSPLPKAHGNFLPVAASTNIAGTTILPGARNSTHAPANPIETNTLGEQFSTSAFAAAYARALPVPAQITAAPPSRPFR